MTDYLLVVKKLTERLKLKDLHISAASNGPRGDLVQPNNGLSIFETAYENDEDAPEAICNSSYVDDKNNGGLFSGEENNILGINIHKVSVEDTYRQEIPSDRLRIYSCVSSTNNIHQAINCRKLSGNSEQNAKTANAVTVMPHNAAERENVFRYRPINDHRKRNGAVSQNEGADKTVSLQQIRYRKPRGVLIQKYLAMYQEVLGDKEFLGGNYSNQLKHTSSKLPRENDTRTSSEENLQCTNSFVKDTSKRRVSATRSMPALVPIQTREWQSRRYCELQKKKDTLTSELMTMQKSDQEIARKLLQLYSEIHFTKVKQSCLSYSELLDEAIYNAEMEDKVPDMCDLPHKSMNRLLLDRGVTRLNISSRRFSCI